MSSSGSEDDCYGNVAQKLQSIKSQYHNIVSETESNPLKESDAEEVANSPKNDKEATKNDIESVDLSLNNTDNYELTLDAIIASNSRPRGRGRGKRKFIEDPVFEISSARVTRSSRRKTSNSVNVQSSAPTTAQESAAESDSVQETSSSTSTRGRIRGSRRGRGRNTLSRGRGRAREPSRNFSYYESYQIPTFSVGNTDEYPDTCGNQQLFSTKSDDIVLIEEPDPLEEDEELSVKVYWQNVEVYKFNVRKYQKLSPIFEYFTKKESICEDKLLFTYNERILKTDDTPDSINYNIAKFIDGGIVSQNVIKPVKDTHSCNDKDGVRIKFQCQDVKKPYETTVRPEETLAQAMKKFAEHIEKPLERLKFYFDGDLITSKSTPLGLELEGGECIDVKLSS